MIENLSVLLDVLLLVNAEWRLNSELKERGEGS